MSLAEHAARPPASYLRVAAAASLSAGAVHAAAVGAHRDHRAAVWAFALLAAAQLLWGAVALRRTDRATTAVGVGFGALAVAGWVLAKGAGLPFVDGLDGAEPIQAADAIAAGLAAVAGGASLTHLTGRAHRPLLTDGVWARGALGLLGVAALAGMVTTGTHDHTGAHVATHDDAAHGEAVDLAAADGHAGSGHPGGAHVEGDDAVPRPYDPALPIDLGGVPGVSPEQQARAENLVAVTLLRLPRFADTAVAEAHGYHSIGDAVTGYEHYVNRALINDEVILDPDAPESLVYQVRDGVKQLVAAMFMLPEGETLDTVPDVGGRLTQWHIHDDLCYTTDPIAPRVAGLTGADGTCAPPLVKGLEVPMIHVWVVPHRCGPFAALEGIAGGQIRAGEERWCDHAHGSA